MSQVKQALWPQCQSCFQQQGVAVLKENHKLIYHHALRLQHFSLLFGLLTASNPMIVDTTDRILKFIDNFIQKINIAILDILVQLIKNRKD
jgi:hypothetical protein